MNDNQNFIEDFTNVFAHENGLTTETATKLVTWLESEGALDYAVIRETYEEKN